MKLAVIGSRQFNDYDFFVNKINEYIDLSKITVFISGGAKGADSLAERLAKDKGFEMIVFKPDYKQYSRAATFIRNREIINHADIIVAFWDGKSSGTRYTIDYAKRQAKILYIVQF